MSIFCIESVFRRIMNSLEIRNLRRSVILCDFLGAYRTKWHSLSGF